MKSERILTSKTPPVVLTHSTVGQYAWLKINELNDHHICAVSDKHLETSLEKIYARSGRPYT